MLAISSCLLALATAASAQIDVLVQPGQNADAFGQYNGIIWHKYAENWTWKTKDVEFFAGSNSLRGLGEPTTVSWGPDHAQVFYAGTDKNVYTRWRSALPNTWIPEVNASAPMGRSLGGPVDSELAVVSRGPNLLNAFARGSDNTLLHKYWVGGPNWGPTVDTWEKKGDQLASRPTAIYDAKADRIHVWGISTGGKLLWTYADPKTGGWVPSKTSWYLIDIGDDGPFNTSLTFDTNGNPTASFAGRSYPAVFIVKDDTLYDIGFPDVPLFGRPLVHAIEARGLVNKVRLVSAKANSIDWLLQDTTATPRHYNLKRVYDGNSWWVHRYEWFRDTLTEFKGAGAISSWKEDHVNVLGQTTNGQLVQKYRNPSPWNPDGTNWAPIGNLTVLKPLGVTAEAVGGEDVQIATKAGESPVASEEATDGQRAGGNYAMHAGMVVQAELR